MWTDSRGSLPVLPSPVPPHVLDELITPERAQRYRQVLARRCRRLAVVIEDVYDPHNATAIIRSCDAFGIDRVHVVTARNAFKVNRRVSQGSHHYVDLHTHASIDEAYAALRADDYRIWVSDLRADAVAGPQHLRGELDRGPLALVFGSEGEGVSAEASADADGFFLIPMVGFPQSLNVSVSAAVTLYALRQDALAEDRPGDLDTEQQCERYDAWIRRHKGTVGEAWMRRQAGRHGEDLDVFDRRPGADPAS